MAVEGKTCSRCEEWKTAEHYYIYPRAKSGLASRCKECQRKVSRIWNQENVERASRSRKAWREANPEKNKEIIKNWLLANPEKAKEYQRKSRSKASHKRKQRAWHLKRIGFTPELEQQLLIAQNNRCAICGAQFNDESRPHADHNHTTGEPRGLLCQACNHGLGNFRDDPRLMTRAIAYLETHQALRERKAVVESILAERGKGKP